MKAPTPPKAVLFDLDDTLFDHRYARLAALHAMRQAHAPLSGFPLARLDRSYEHILAEIHFSQVLTREISLEESRTLRMTRFLEEFGLLTDPTDVRRLLRIRQATYRRHRRAVPGAVALLQFLKSSGTKIGVVTNNLRSEQEEKLRITGLDDWVDYLVCSEQVGVTKPDPRMFRAALAEIHGTPRTTVMVGDSWESDVVGAARVGIRPVWFHRDRTAPPASPPAGELRSFRPLDRAAAVILGRPERAL
ncbi:MAG: HAD family hydrolase [Thermoplasmata archaeon]|nr:HAD family hydrolase [Thermoplasmata archaeon]